MGSATTKRPPVEPVVLAAREAVETARIARANEAGALLEARLARRARIALRQLEDDDERAALLATLEGEEGRHSMTTPKGAHSMGTLCADPDEHAESGDDRVAGFAGAKTLNPFCDTVRGVTIDEDDDQGDEHEEEPMSDENEDGAPETESTRGSRRRRASPARPRKVPEHACPCGATVRSNIGWASHRRTCPAAGKATPEQTTARPDAIEALLVARAALRELAPDARRAALSLLLATCGA